MKNLLKGKKLIEEALACGNFIVTYTHGVMLLCESNPKGICNLLEVLDDEHRLLKGYLCLSDLIQKAE